MSSGCIEWQANRLKTGYGLIRSGGAKMPRLLAHRCAYELAYGAIPSGMNVLHKCDNPRCVNHEHLFLGTQQDNVNDMVAKKRHAWRNGTPWQKLDAKDSQAIREMRAAGFSQQAIADHFKVSRPLISLLLAGKLQHSPRSSGHF